MAYDSKTWMKTFLYGRMHKCTTFIFTIIYSFNVLTTDITL